MKQALLLTNILFTIGSSILGQTTEFKNLLLTHQPESKIVYIGIDNFFKITSVLRIERIESSEASVIFNSDTMKLLPRRSGKVNVSVRTSAGVQVITFDAYRLPELSVTISFDSTSIIQKDNLINFGKIVLLGGKKDIGGFAANYKIRTWQAQLNDEIFLVEGDNFSDNLKKAIRDCKSGSSFIIGNIEAYNPENNEQIKISQKMFSTYSIQ